MPSEKIFQEQTANNLSDNGDKIAVIMKPKSEKEEWTFEEALKVIGFGKVQVQLLAIVGLILVSVLNETMGIAYILPAGQCDLNMSTADKGFVSSMTFLGIMISSYFWGFLGDTQGRRNIILFSLLFTTLFTLSSAFVKNFAVYAFCRFMTGIFVAGYSATAYAYIGEFNSAKNRASIISLVSVSIGVAAIFQPLSAWWILSYDFKFELYDGYFFRPWRLIAIIYSMPGIISGLLLLKFPESPKFLLAQNRVGEALKIMQWMHRTNKGGLEKLEIKELKSEAVEVLGRNHKGLKALMMSLVDQTFPLFKPPFAIHFFACCFLHFGTFSVSGGMALFLPEILNRLSSSTGDDLKICDIFQTKALNDNSTDSVVTDIACDDSVNSSVFIDSAYIGLGYLFGFILLAFVIKPLGRRKIFVITLLTSGVSGFLLTLVTSHFLIITLYCSFILFCGLNVSVINGAACDLFPTRLRAMSVCVAMMIGRLGSVISTNGIGFFLEKNCELTYYTFSGFVLVCFAVSFIIPSHVENVDEDKNKEKS